MEKRNQNKYLILLLIFKTLSCDVLVKDIPCTNLRKIDYMNFVFITGASGAGKTFLTQKLDELLNKNDVQIFYFDTIGIPSVHDMIKNYGSCEAWQEHATNLWISKLGSCLNKKIVILEGQFNPQFVINSCKQYGIQNYKIILIHAADKIRNKRLTELRNQPDLATQDMIDWANFLKTKTLEVGGIIIDTSNSDFQKNINEILKFVKI